MSLPALPALPCARGPPPCRAGPLHLQPRRSAARLLWGSLLPRPASGHRGFSNVAVVPVCSLFCPQRTSKSHVIFPSSPFIRSLPCIREKASLCVISAAGHAAPPEQGRGRPAGSPGQRGSPPLLGQASEQDQASVLSRNRSRHRASRAGKRTPPTGTGAAGSDLRTQRSLSARWLRGGGTCHQVSQPDVEEGAPQAGHV